MDNKELENKDFILGKIHGLSLSIYTINCIKEILGNVEVAVLRAIIEQLNTRKEIERKKLKEVQ